MLVDWLAVGCTVVRLRSLICKLSMSVRPPPLFSTLQAGANWYLFPELLQSLGVHNLFFFFFISFQHLLGLTCPAPQHTRYYNAALSRRMLYCGGLLLMLSYHISAPLFIRPMPA